MKFKKLIMKLWYIILIFVMLPYVSALTLQELIDSYNFGYNDGTLNINLFNDYMIDSNSNGQNDTLVINLTVNSTYTAFFDVYFDLSEESGTLSNKINQSLSSGISNINISFDTRLLTKNKYNYSVRIYNSNNSTNLLIFSKYNVETNTYKAFENGTSINRITDENINNDYIRINLTLNATESQDVNITAYLKFNQTTISATKQITLASGLQTVSLDFDNETVKSTHYNGNFTLDYILIGKKLIRPSYTTSVYNYEDFAKTSYFRNYSSSGIDTNANNLSEFLEINFTIAVKNVNTYEIQSEIFDQFNNFVKNLSITQSLSLGNQTVAVRINGSDIYATKISGPYILTATKLIENSNIIDKQFEPHTILNLTYTDFERPLLPDLKVEINVSFNQTTNITNITVEITNIGESPAFNIFLDIFNNETFSTTNNTVIFNINQSQNYTFTVSNTSNTTLFTAIADFDNLVDESNESNNIVQNVEEAIIQPEDTTPPFINITSPRNNTVYNTTFVDLNWTANETLDWCAYNLDNGANNTDICEGWSNLNGWNCRNEITLQNNYSIDMIGIPIRINIIKDLLDFNPADFKNNGEDVRFTDTQNNILSSFVEVWDEENEQTIAWVNTTIPANSNTTIHLYHCNQNADAYNSYNFMDSFENFTSGSTPSGWQVSGNAGFNDGTIPLTQPYSAYFVSGLDGNNFNPPLPPSTNYTIDFYYYTVNSVDNGYFQDAGSIFRWEDSTSEYPQISFTCHNESGETPSVKLVNKWIRAVVIRDREKDIARIRFYDNETLLSQCNGTRSGYATSQTRSDWSFTGGNGGSGTLRIDNFKLYKNFGWNTSDITLYASNKITGQNKNITLTNLSAGLHNITIYGNDTSGNMGQSEHVYFNVTLPDIDKFDLVNSAGAKVGWIGDAGNIVLKGMLEQNSNYEEQPNDLFAMEENGKVFIVIAQNGSMYIDGTLSENYQGAITSPETANDFGMYGSDGSLVGLVNTSGYMFLKGNLIENGNP